MMRNIFGLALLGVLCGCSGLRSASNRFVIEKRWVRSTVEGDFLEGRRIHRFTPILMDDLVITANAIDGVMAFERETAHRRWRLPIKDGVEGGATLYDGVLYFGAGDGQFYAVNAESGALVWTYPLKAEGISEPTVNAGVVFVLGGNNVAHALDAKSGKLIWTYNRREASNISVRGGAQPTVSGEAILFGFSDGFLVALNKSSGAVMWETNLNRNKRFRDVDASPVVDGDMIVASSYDGALYGLNRVDGKVVWSVDGGGYDRAVVVDETVYFTSTNGKTMALDRRSGKVRWSRDNPGGIGVGPVLYRNILIVNEMDGEVRFLDPQSGERVGSFAPGRGATSRAAIDEKRGEVYFMSHDANLFALRANWQKLGSEWPWERE